MAEFQAVIVAGAHEGSELFPLTNLTPKPLLPLVNTPLLAYQLSLLRKAKFSSVIVVLPEEYAAAVRAYVVNIPVEKDQKGKEIKLDIKIRSVPAMRSLSTMDMLKRIKDDIKTNVLLLFDDLITDISLHDLANLHRINDCSMTIALKELPSGQTIDETKKLRKRYTVKGVVKYFGMVSPDQKARGLDRFYNRLLFLKTHSSGENLSVPKALLKRESRMVVRTDVVDPHLYIMKKWVFDLMLSKPKMSSIQDDFIPYFVQLQYRKPDTVLPADILETMRNDLSTVYEMNSEANLESPDTCIKCYALVNPHSRTYCERVDSVANYLTMNKEVMNRPVSPLTPWKLPKNECTWTKEKGIDVKSTIVDKGCIAEAGCSFKDSVIGENVKVGSGSKLNNCIVLKGAVIQDDCKLQSCIICENSVIESRCSLRECQIAANTVVSEKTNAKAEMFISEQQDMVAF